MLESSGDYILDCGRKGTYTDSNEINTVVANWPWHSADPVEFTKVQPENGHDIYWMTMKIRSNLGR